MGLDPAHRTQHRHSFVTFVSSVVKAFDFNSGERKGSEEIRAAYTSRFLSGTHKNLQRLVIYPIYSVVKYRPHQLALDHPASAGMGLTKLPECANSESSSNPMFGVKYFH